MEMTWGNLLSTWLILELKDMCKLCSETKHESKKSNNADGMLMFDINGESHLIEKRISKLSW